MTLIEQIKDLINRVENGNNVDNGFITLDETDENGDRKVVWIPENVHWVPPKERSRVLKICDAYKQGDETKYDFSHTRTKLSESQVKYLKDTVNKINDLYSYKGIAQVEISSSLNNGSWGVCYAPNNTSLISISPSMYKENGQERYDNSVKEGFHPKGTGDCIKSVLVHEIGHAITCNSKNEKFWNSIDTIRKDYLKNIKEDDINNPDFISNYARENRFEFVAEAFCQGHLSKKYGKYTKQVMELMQEHFSKAHQTKLFNSKEEDNQEMWIEGFGFGYPIDEEEYKKFRKDIKEEKEKDTKESKADNSLEEAFTEALAEIILEQ